jgi:hypothetical protein
MTLVVEGAPAAFAGGAPALRLRPIPVAEPRPARGVLPPPDGDPPGQAVLPLAAAGVASRVVQPWRPARPPGLPDPVEWAGQAARVALEVATGLRPPAQLVRWSTQPVLAALTRRHALAQRGGGRPARAAVRSLRVCEPAPAVAEVAAVVTDGTRVRALAFRMEGEGERWRISAFELG